MQIQGHAFAPRDLVGGHVVLDLVNTVTARNAGPIDWLDDYARLLGWAALTGEFEQPDLAALKGMSAADSRAAAVALDCVRDLRETLHAVLAAAIRTEVAPATALAALERSWKDAVAHTRLTVSGGQVRLQLDAHASGLDYLSHELTRRAIELLQTLPLERTRICGGPRCGWLFIDRSKGGQRRWCDMATCGNAAKSRRHYERRRIRRRISAPPA